MKKMGTKIRRGIILTSMFVVMSSSMVLAARYEDSYGFESMHRCENSLHQVGFNCRLSG